jgi:hypothetical protein
MRNLPAFIESLTKANVDFVVVGGFAVQLHGFVRATVDLDLTLAMDDDNLSRFIAVATQFGMTPVNPIPLQSLRDSKQIDIWHKEKGMIAFALQSGQYQEMIVDVLVRPVVTFEKLKEGASVTHLFDSVVQVAGIEDLLVMKRVANRLKDRLDIEALERIQRGEDPYE